MNSSKDKYLFNGDENLLKSVECFCVRSAKENFGFASSYSLISGWEVSFLAFHVESWKYFSIETLKLNKFKVLHCIKYSIVHTIPTLPILANFFRSFMLESSKPIFDCLLRYIHSNTQKLNTGRSLLPFCPFCCSFSYAHTVSITPQLKYEQYFM